MIFSTLKSLSIPEGTVTKITDESGNIIWSSAPVSRLPAEYQELEYIFVNRTVEAYIDLGFAYDGGATVEIGQKIYDDETTYIFGAAENNGKLRCMFSSPYNGAVTIYGSKGDAHLSMGLTYWAGELNKMKSIFKPGAWQGVNYTSGFTAATNTSLTDYKMTNNLYLFGQNYNGAPRYGGTRHITFFKYYDKDDKLICSLVPCYRKSDRIAGMYDTVREIFLTNVLNNGVVFNMGPEVNGNVGDVTYTNILLQAVGDDGNVYNEHGYTDGMRWSSSGNNATTHPVGRLSGWMSYEKGAVYRYKNFYMQEGYVSGTYVIYKKTDGTTFAETAPLNGNSNYVVDFNNDICSFQARLDDVVAFRISGYSGVEAPIVTKNEEIPL